MALVTFASETASSTEPEPSKCSPKSSSLPMETKLPLLRTSKSTGSVMTRNLGKCGLRISNLSLCCSAFFSSSGVEEEEGVRGMEVVKQALKMGINMFDVSHPSAEVQMAAERNFGRIVRSSSLLANRRVFSVSTRVFWSMNSQQRSLGLSRKDIIESVRLSLRNLQLDYVDLLLIDKYDPACPMEELVRAVSFCVDKGLVMYWGTARWTPVEIFEAYSLAKTIDNCHPPVCEMAEYHCFHRNKVELNMAELYNKIGFGLMTWAPVANGPGPFIKGQDEMDGDAKSDFLKMDGEAFLRFHARAITNGSMSMEPGFTSNLGSPPTLPSGGTLLQSLQVISDRLHCTVCELMFAWCLRNQTCTSHLISARSVEQLNALVNCLTIVPKLTFHVCEEIDKILTNKPARPPMVSTLQQRWATTGGVPPC